MNRRKFLSLTATTLGAVGINVDPSAAAGDQSSLSQESSSSAGRDRRPNVLILMSDQHKRSCMGVAGDTTAVTPNLDRLARESIRFTNAYCTNPVCAPSRASIMTGLYSHHLGSRGNSKPFSPKHKTVADHFSRAGYMTSLIGKMHFVDAQTHGFNYKLEFNDWYQALGPTVKLYADEVGGPNSGAGLPQIAALWRKEGDPWKGYLKPDHRLGPCAVGRVSDMEEESHFENFVARESIRFLENYARENEPFFLVSSFLKPHAPFMPAKRFAEMFEPEQMKLSPSWGKADLKHLPKEVRYHIEDCPITPELKDPVEARKRMAYYYGNLAQMDDCAGKVLDTLRRLGLDRNTIVVYTADHGDMLGDLGLWQKFQFYEGSCGVPLMIRVPGMASSICDTPLSLISLTATIADLCQVPLSGPSDGRSFADLVRRPEVNRTYGPVFAEYNLGSQHAKYMVRDGQYKYTYWVHDIDELYDLRTDPEELRNLASEPKYKPTVERLRAELFAWHRPTEG